MAIARVVRLELKDHYVALTTGKDERFAFAYEDVLGFKLAAPGPPKIARPASAAARSVGSTYGWTTADDPTRWLRRACAPVLEYAQVHSGPVLGPASPSGRLVGRCSLVGELRRR